MVALETGLEFSDLKYGSIVFYWPGEFQNHSGRISGSRTKKDLVRIRKDSQGSYDIPKKVNKIYIPHWMKLDSSFTDL